jgi:spermidine synthase
MGFYLYFTVFASGLTTLGVEFAASRLLGSVFGTSNLVWASIIGLILIYLTLGYFLGGRWADRSPHFQTFYRILAWGAFTAGLIPFIARPVLIRAADAFDHLRVGVLLGSFTAVLILFVIPITLLGTISPFAIRLALKDSRRAGEISGKVYAISTLGSFLGTFTPDLFLIPWLGTRLTFMVLAVFLLLVALIGIGLHVSWVEALKQSWMPVVLIILGVVWGSGPIKETPGQIYEEESSYNYIQVLEQGETRYLRLNEGQGVHSIYHPDRLTFGGTWMQVLSAPFFNPAPYHPDQVDRIAIIGLAAGTSARQAAAAYDQITIDGFEIDPAIIEVGLEYFGMDLPELNPIAQDGRWGLVHTADHTYSVISIDAYRPPYIPWHFTTREFFLSAYERLDQDGVLVLNVGRSPNDQKLLSGLVATIRTVFPSVYVMDVPESFNSMIYATVQPTSRDNLTENLAALASEGDPTGLLRSAVERTVNNLRPLPEGGMVFTDDRAPIEWITNQMVLNFFLSDTDLELIGE